MHTHSRNLQAILVLALACLGLWLGFGPQGLGGPVAYVIISGNSMAPDFQLGDLVLARKETFYQLNDPVVYNNPKVGYVFHRIVDQDQGSFILKGDNNDWLDSHHPTQAEILGKYWFKITGAGNWIRTLREPIHFTGLALVLAVIIGTTFLVPEERPGRKSHRSGKAMPKKPPSTRSGDYRQELLFMLGILALAALALGAISISRPLTIQVADDLSYTHQGEFTYTASNQPGVYDAAGITTGDPIYPRLVCQVDLQFGYSLLSPHFRPGEEQKLQGSFGLQAVVRDVDGWKRSYLLIPSYDFSGRSVQAASSLNLCRILKLIQYKEEKTGTEIRWYTLTILPEIRISGELAGVEFEDTYQPEISFDLSQTVLRLPEGDSEFQLSQEGVLPQTAEIENTLSIMGWRPTVLGARRISAAALALSLLGAAYPAWSLLQDWNASSAARIRVQNHPLLIDVQRGGVKKRGQKTIQVVSFADLRKMAERYNAVILHEADHHTHVYSIEDEGTLYQYTLTEGSDPAPGQDQDPDPR